MSVDALLESLTLEEKVGQVLMVGMEETYLSPALKARLERFHVGNVIFLGRNYVDPRQMRAFTDDLQRLAAARRTPIGFPHRHRPGGRSGRPPGQRRDHCVPWEHGAGGRWRS